MTTITRFKEILDIQSLAGFDKTIIRKLPDNQYLISAMTDEKDMVIIEKVKDSGLVDETYAVNDISSLIKRLELFDLNNVMIEEEVTNEFTSRLLLKDDKRSVLQSFPSPHTMEMPTDTIPSTIVSSFTLDKSLSADILKSAGIFKTELVSIFVRDGKLVFSVVDDGKNEFQMDIGETSINNVTYIWDKTKFLRLIKNSISSSDNDTVVIGISDRGWLFVPIKGITVILFPTVKK